QRSDRRTASGAASRIPQQHFAGSVRGRTPARRDAIREPAAVERGLFVGFVVNAQRGGGADGKLAFDENNNPPLCNLFVSMLQRMDIEADKFGSSTGPLTGLEMRG